MDHVQDNKPANEEPDPSVTNPLAGALKTLERSDENAENGC